MNSIIFELLLSVFLIGLPLHCFGDPLPSGNASNKTIITSNKLSYDYQRNIAMFEEDVVVIDPSINIKADKMNVIFDGEKGLESVTAVGNVKLNYAGRDGSCNKAIYLAKEGLLMLVGNAELRQGTDYVRGNIIRFWVAEDKMTCEPGYLVIESKTAARIQDVNKKSDSPKQIEDDKRRETP